MDLNLDRLAGTNDGFPGGTPVRFAGMTVSWGEVGEDIAGIEVTAFLCFHWERNIFLRKMCTHKKNVQDTFSTEAEDRFWE